MVAGLVPDCLERMVAVKAGKKSTSVLIVCAMIAVGASCGAPQVDERGIADYSGEGSFSALLNVGVVVEATVVGSRGPKAVLNKFGGVDYPGRPERSEDWTTPVGLPLVILGKMTLVRRIGGSPQTEAVASELERAVATSDSIELSVPVGVYEVGGRYQFWVQRWARDEYMSYLAFDERGVLVEGLGLPDADDAFKVLTDFTGDSLPASLAAMAYELNTRTETSQGLILDHVFGPLASVAVTDPSRFPVFEDERPASANSSRSSTSFSALSRGRCTGCVGPATSAGASPVTMEKRSSAGICPSVRRLPLLRSRLAVKPSISHRLSL